MIFITYRAYSEPESSDNTGQGSRYWYSTEPGPHPLPENEAKHLPDERVYQNTFIDYFLIISVVEADAPSGHSGHEAPPMTHSLFY